MRRDLVSPLFIGRDAELATLTAALETAIGGTPTVVLLGGEAGVGKTRLVEEAAERARAAGAHVLTGSCIELGGEGLPFGPLAHAFRALRRDMSPEDLDALLGPSRSEFARVLPDLGPDLARSTAPLADGGTARLLELVLGSTAFALVLAAAVGAGTMSSEVVADTTLQRSLHPTVFARAYGLVVPACVGGIAGGALLAPPLVALLGLDATLVLTGAVVLTYGALALVRPAPLQPAVGTTAS